MKKLMTLMLGFSLLGGTVAALAQETPKKEDSKDKSKEGRHRKGRQNKKKTETPKNNATR